MIIKKLWLQLLAVIATQMYHPFIINERSNAIAI
jgi:hypothetical protein